MAKVSDESVTADHLLQQARSSWKQDQPQAALEAAWAAFDLIPAAPAIKAFLVKLLREHPAALQCGRRLAYLTLLTDRNVEPDDINIAGWLLVVRSHRLGERASEDALGTLITDLERDELALTLLRESPVSLATAERLLGRLRRWLLLSGRWREHPVFVDALKAQAALNGGAWPFDESERESLAGVEDNSIVAAYLPIRKPEKNTTATDTAAADRADSVTLAVAAQYEAWPYPPWTRITVGKESRLPDVIRKMDAELAAMLPVKTNVLIAGCGTGRQAASFALRYPDAAVTAIDISEASLDYAKRQCLALGIANLRFLKLDLHDVAAINLRFHAIACAGVLHHLSDPERSLKLLADVLEPGGVMRIMVYNRYERLMVNGARAFLIKDLMQEPMSDDLLRRVRQRFLAQTNNPSAAYVVGKPDFATLAGTHDLLLHRHEDPFDLPRIERALDHAGMDLLSFDMSTPAIAARYDAMFPDDPKHRDIKSLIRFEMSDPSLTARHYRFWCCLPLSRY